MGVFGDGRLTAKELGEIRQMVRAFRPILRPHPKMKSELLIAQLAEQVGNEAIESARKESEGLGLKANAGPEQAA